MKGLNRRTYGLLVLLVLVGVCGALVRPDLVQRVGMWFGYKPKIERPPTFVDPLEVEARAPVAPSPWKEAEKKRYAAVLAESKPDVVVLPYQIPVAKRDPYVPYDPRNNRFGVDLSARMVMAYMTAQRLALDSKLKVADVELAALATGEPRHMTRDEAVAFARSIGSSTVVYGQTWHDGQGNLSVKIVRVSTKSGGEEKTAAAERISISDALPPELAFRKVIDSLMRDIGVSAALPVKQYTVPDKFFPEDPVSATADADNPVAGIWTQQLLGSLHGGWPLRGGARVYERALAGLEFVDPRSPDYRLLAARALSRLERRPAAVEMIGTPQSPEEAAFVEYLNGNGNAPDLAAAIEKISRPLPKLLARLDLAHHLYGNETLEMEERYAKSAPPAWQPAVVWNLALRNQWVVRSTVELKQVLDQQFPVPNYSTEDLLRGKAAGARDDRRLAYELEGLVLEHGRKVLAHSGAQWCCAPAAWQPRPFQYLRLLTTLSEAMLLHALERTNRVHGLSENALADAELLGDTALQGGHPQLQQGTMVILSDLMNGERAPEKRSARAHRLYDIARQVRQWETADPTTALHALKHEQATASMRFPSRAGFRYPQVNQFEDDFPPTPYMLENSEVYTKALSLMADVDIIRRACSYTTLYSNSCIAWRSALHAKGRSEEARKFDEELGVRRFKGNEVVASHIVLTLNAAGKTDEARAFAAKAIAIAPERSTMYIDLGYVHLVAAEFDAARKAFLAYPAFREGTKTHTVKVSNDALWVANAFANRGATREARHFYEIAERQANGSYAHYAARAQLAIMDGRFGDAAGVLLTAAQRYPGGSNAYRYSAMLFALGDSKTAWAVTREAMVRHPERSGAFAVPVAFRMEQTDAAAIGAWAVETARLPSGGHRSADDSALNALVIAIQTLAMDRNAGALDAFHKIRNDVMPSRKVRSTFTADATHPKNMQLLELDYIDRFVAGYSAHKRNDFEAAWHAFQTFPIEPKRSNDSYATTLPYHAYAAGRTGRGAEFLSFLDEYEKLLHYVPLDRVPQYRSKFDSFLARAILAAAAGNHAEGDQHLLRARSHDQRMDTRILQPEYVFVEICELLGADSGRRKYLDIGVSFAKAYQVNVPWAAWAYAFEALHGTNERERVKAYAIARHLDPQSARLRRVDAAIAKKADEWLRLNKPFPNERAGQQPGTKL